ncbi:hypothetical protein NQ318_005610 [Aromia moschata]|uniref:DUF4817 domain-containing protein n=1 Tax=Aromia moschata TaxID=1265417 RepID=A0AAV8XTV6_9CUCU|nr:hypothetical protein NQ318_005610 [Aromia moschata]
MKAVIQGLTPLPAVTERRCPGCRGANWKPPRGAPWITLIPVSNCTAEYISGGKGESDRNIHLKGLKCVTVLIGVFNTITGLPVMGVVNRPFLEEDDFMYDVVVKQERKQVCEIFKTKYPDRRISQSTVSRIENKFREFGNVTDIPKSGRKRILDDEQKLDILLYIQDNSHKPTRQVAADNDVKCSSLYGAMQQQAFYFISRKYVHDVQQK